ncbi:flagellar basal body protein [Flagellatimonas centrodinii]|uniref:flagellar basal body rod protein FlgB n=1 Tax=Flagellatimonas centrodinii TaxID=2806210 RepID=UPI001FEF8089|nr:flagellar basal body protein [Flagellatimonas centrodinii]ULQ45691.1 flagellar basal body protein [Flagellatimonas centrodinii]
MSQPLNMQRVFGVHEPALALHARRLELITGNLANADTPGYVPRDLDFAKALTAAGDTPLDFEAAQFERYASQPSVDGNRVDLPREQAAFADAALHYQASLNFLESRVRGLLTAITGQ